MKKRDLYKELFYRPRHPSNGTNLNNNNHQSLRRNDRNYRNSCLLFFLGNFCSWYVHDFDGKGNRLTREKMIAVMILSICKDPSTTDVVDCDEHLQPCLKHNVLTANLQITLYMVIHERRLFEQNGTGSILEDWKHKCDH